MTEYEAKILKATCDIADALVAEVFPKGQVPPRHELDRFYVAMNSLYGYRDHLMAMERKPYIANQEV